MHKAAVSSSPAHGVDRRVRLAMRCAVLPAMLAANRNFAGARRELHYLAELAKKSHRPDAPTGIIPRSPVDRAPDAVANLWFARAANAFFAAAKERDDCQFAADVLLPIQKQIVQDFVAAGGIDGTRMDDGGLLSAPAPGPDAIGDLRLNALWYCAMDTTGSTLRDVSKRDQAADHFERLAGRFRRSFAKAYWCDEHQRACTAEARAEGEGHGSLPDPEQILLAVLPASPLPRTKQKQLLKAIVSHALGEVGVLMKHPAHGVVESVLHRAWLVQGLLATDATPAGRTQAMRIAAPLEGVRGQASDATLLPLYHNGSPLPKQRPDPLTNVEVLAALSMLESTPG